MEIEGRRVHGGGALKEDRKCVLNPPYLNFFSQIPYLQSSKKSMK